MKFTIYTKGVCPYCTKAKQLMERTGHEYTELAVPNQASKDDIQLRINESGSDHVVRSVPQIFHGDRYVGGFDKLEEYIRGI